MIKHKLSLSFCVSSSDQSCRLSHRLFSHFLYCILLISTHFLFSSSIFFLCLHRPFPSFDLLRLSLEEEETNSRLTAKMTAAKKNITGKLRRRFVDEGLFRLSIAILCLLFLSLNVLLQMINDDDDAEIKYLSSQRYTHLYTHFLQQLRSVK